MEKILSHCGLDCQACPAYQATIRDSYDERVKVAKTWSEEYGVDLGPEDINCRGCIAEVGPYFAHCYKCDIRKCSMSKGFVNCSECSEMETCEIVGALFEVVPDAKNNLMEVRKKQ